MNPNPPTTHCCQPPVLDHLEYRDITVGRRRTKLFLGCGPLALEVVVVGLDGHPRIAELRAMFRAPRHAGADRRAMGARTGRRCAARPSTTRSSIGTCRSSRSKPRAARHWRKMDGTLRLYPAKPGVGTGRRGRSETFVEINLDLLSGDDSGYLWLLLSVPATRPRCGERGTSFSASNRRLLPTPGRYRGHDPVPGPGGPLAKLRSGLGATPLL